jgi:hypothetical protein
MVRISGLIFAAYLVDQGWVFWPTVIALGLLGAFNGLHAEFAERSK